MAFHILQWKVESIIYLIIIYIWLYIYAIYAIARIEYCYVCMMYHVSLLAWTYIKTMLARYTLIQHRYIDTKILLSYRLVKNKTMTSIDVEWNIDINSSSCFKLLHN